MNTNPKAPILVVGVIILIVIAGMIIYRSVPHYKQPPPMKSWPPAPNFNQPRSTDPMFKQGVEKALKAENGR